MSARKISQADARRLRAENQRLRDEREAIFRRGASQYPGVHIDTVTLNDTEWHIIDTARKRGHAVFLVPTEGVGVRVYALAPPK